MEKRKQDRARQMATDAKLRNLLRKAKPDQTMSQSEIAEQAGISRQLVNRIERGAILKLTEQIARIVERRVNGYTQRRITKLFRASARRRDQSAQSSPDPLSLIVCKYVENPDQAVELIHKMLAGSNHRDRATQRDQKTRPFGLRLPGQSEQVHRQKETGGRRPSPAKDLCRRRENLRGIHARFRSNPALGE